MENKDIVHHLMEIKESIAELKTQGADLKEDMSQHRKEAHGTRAEVEDIKVEISRAKGIAVGLSLITTLLSVAAAAKAFILK